MPIFSPNHDLITVRLRDAGCVFAEEEARLLITEAKTASKLDDMVQQRVAGLPLEYILGWAEFCGLRIAVDQGVFIPRHRTEFLVQRAIALVSPKAVVVDLCCGTGALGLALATAVDQVQLYAADIDPRAVHCAQRNVAGHGKVFKGDLFSPLPVSLKGRIDIVMANVPYVPTEAIEFMPREARLHEPRPTLDGGADGLDVLRRVASAAPRWLAPGGYLLSEISGDQTSLATAIFTASGLSARIVHSEDLNATVIIGATINS